jgi:hypothetical protein
MILKTIEQDMQNLLRINKEKCDFTKIIIEFLIQFDFKDVVKLSCIDDLF